MTAADPIAFGGRWVKRGGVMVPIPPDPEPAPLVDPPCINCGRPSLTTRCAPCRAALAKRRAEHVPSHSSFNLHKAHGQTPCWDCQVAEKEYQHRAYLRKKGQKQ